LKIKWEGQDIVLGTVPIEKETTIKEVYLRLLVEAPELKNEKFCFLHNGIPVKEELWELASASKLLPVAYLKQGEFDFIRRTPEVVPGEALADMRGESSQAILSVSKGDRLELSRYDKDSDWWYGKHVASGTEGWVPQSHVKLLQ